MNIKEISLPTFIWYVLPGINAIFFLVVLPITILDFELLANSFSWITVVGWLMGGLIIGFLMDSMKIYKFTYGYRKLKDRFFKDLAKAVGGNEGDRNVGRNIFVVMRLMMDEEKNLFPFWEHSRWVMINHTSKTAFLAVILWGYLLGRLWGKEIILFNRYPLSQIESQILLASLIVTFSLISYRLHRVSLGVIREANLVYMKYILKNKASIISTATDGLVKCS
jgi:hypothetical protein